MDPIERPWAPWRLAPLENQRALPQRDLIVTPATSSATQKEGGLATHLRVAPLGGALPPHPSSPNGEVVEPGVGRSAATGTIPTLPRRGPCSGRPGVSSESAMVGKLVGVCRDFGWCVPGRGDDSDKPRGYTPPWPTSWNLSRFQRRYLPVRGGAVQQDRQVEGRDLPRRDPQEPERRTEGLPRGERWRLDAQGVRIRQSAGTPMGNQADSWLEWAQTWPSKRLPGESRLCSQRVLHCLVGAGLATMHRPPLGRGRCTRLAGRQ
jgi:hypothetical protein